MTAGDHCSGPSWIAVSGSVALHSGSLLLRALSSTASLPLQSCSNQNSASLIRSVDALLGTFLGSIGGWWSCRDEIRSRALNANAFGCFAHFGGLSFASESYLGSGGKEFGLIGSLLA